jgi:hypothetical protein
LASRSIDFRTFARRSSGVFANDENWSAAVVMPARAWSSRRLRHFSAGQQLAWLREAEFVEVSCSYRDLIFAVLSGTKPAMVREARSDTPLQ